MLVITLPGASKKAFARGFNYDFCNRYLMLWTVAAFLDLSS